MAREEATVRESKKSQEPEQESEQQWVTAGDRMGKKESNSEESNE